MSPLPVLPTPRRGLSRIALVALLGALAVPHTAGAEPPGSDASPGPECPLSSPSLCGDAAPGGDGTNPHGPPIDKPPAPTLPGKGTTKHKPIHGFAELHTHMFAEHAWGGDFIWGTVDDPSTAQPEPAEVALPRCSGNVDTRDHAILREGYGPSGLGIITEALTGVGSTTAFTGLSGISAGDTGLHAHRRNGWDTRDCIHHCVGPGTCVTQTDQASCEAADPGFCKDTTSGASVSALVSCNTKLTSAACQGSGYCGATGSSWASLADDMNACWTYSWSSCDAGDMCVKRDLFTSLTCGDLSQSECASHGGSGCYWDTGCHHVQGSLECNDLNILECLNHSGPCTWFAGSCRHKLNFQSLTCSDLNQTECANHSNECGWHAQCKHDFSLNSLECSDLTTAQCAAHGSDGCGVRNCEEVNCQWEDWGDCSWDEVWPPSCGQHFEDWPAWDTPTHQQHWWGWVKDAHTKGLQILSASILEVHPLSKLRPGYTDLPYDVIMKQLDAANAFDAAHDWVEIARSPEDARRIIDEGHLALVLTLESEFPFCTEEPCGSGEDETDVVAMENTLDEYIAKGLSGMQVVAHFDNPYAGVGLYDNNIHAMQWLYDRMEEDGDITLSEYLTGLGAASMPAGLQVQIDAMVALYGATSAPLASTFPITAYDQVNDLHSLGAILGGITGLSCTQRGSPTAADCWDCLKDGKACSNVLGLSQTGEELVKLLVKKHMLIDIAHAGDRDIEDIDDLLDLLPHQQEYPLYVSHGFPRAMLVPEGDKGPHQERPTSQAVLEMIRRRGGMFGARTGFDHMYQINPDVPNTCPGSSSEFAQVLAYLTELDVPTGFAVDMQGMIGNAVPRFSDGTARGDAAACSGEAWAVALQQNPVVDDPSTPYTDESDLNTKGLGHIGLLGAYVDDLHAQGLSSAHKKVLWDSAEKFVQMWERTR